MSSNNMVISGNAISDHYERAGQIGHNEQTPCGHLRGQYLYPRVSKQILDCPRPGNSVKGFWALINVFTEQFLQKEGIYWVEFICAQGV